MAARTCPHCSNIVPATLALAYSDGLECPHCHTRLEVANGGRMIAVTVALAAGWLVWHLTRDSDGILGFVLPELYSILTFGAVSPLVLMFTAAMRLAPVVPVAAPAPSGGHGHGGGAHH